MNQQQAQELITSTLKAIGVENAVIETDELHNGTLAFYIGSRVGYEITAEPEEGPDKWFVTRLDYDGGTYWEPPFWNDSPIAGEDDLWGLREAIIEAVKHYALDLIQSAAVVYTGSILDIPAPAADPAMDEFLDIRDDFMERYQDIYNEFMR